MSNVKVIERRPFDINLTMQWNDIQELLTRCKRMWASAENPADFEILEDMEYSLEILANSIRTRLDKS
jgi:hypothetical protein